MTYTRDTGYPLDPLLFPTSGRFGNRQITLVEISFDRAMFNNEAIYPDPFEFKPERFINDDQSPATDPRDVGFGFGRRYLSVFLISALDPDERTYFSRICPGRHLAFYTIWIAMASIIAAFNIEKTVDENGNVTEFSQEYVSALLARNL